MNKIEFIGNLDSFQKNEKEIYTLSKANLEMRFPSWINSYGSWSKDFRYTPFEIASSENFDSDNMKIIPLKINFERGGEQTELTVAIRGTFEEIIDRCYQSTYPREASFLENGKTVYRRGKFPSNIDPKGFDLSEPGHTPIYSLKSLVFNLEDKELMINSYLFDSLGRPKKILKSVTTEYSGVE